MTIKTFRGLLTDSAPGYQNRIRLAGGKLEDGYRIVKFELMTNTPGTVDHAEHIVKVFSKSQKVIDGTVDFTDPDLLAAGVTFNRTDASAYYPTNNVIFDHVIINQDIYITHFEAINALSCNYYLELEQVKMSGPEAAAVNFRAALVHGGPD